MSKIDANTLSWVKSEIDETLNQARTSLEAFVEDTSDDTQIRFCINYLHQVHGTLQMVELYGAAMAIEEMEKLAIAVHEDKVSNKNDAYETLMRGILQVPDYLEHLMAGNADTPIVLLPLLNDIRAARGEALLSEGALFTPDLTINAPAVDVSISVDQGLPNLIKKLRHKYHLGLLAWFKDEHPEAGLQQIEDVISELTKSAESDEARRMLWVANGLVESLRQGGVETSVAAKMLLGQVDRQLKKILDVGELALDEEPPKELEKNLLYYVATSTTAGDITKEVKDAFNLQDIMPDSSALEQARADLHAPNAALMGTVSSVILEDINKVKDNLDVFVRAEDKDMSLLEQTHAILTQMSDTLAMLSLGVQRQAVGQQAEIIQEIISGVRKDTDKELMSVAAAMISVENSLSEVSSARSAGTDAVDGDQAVEQLKGAEQQKLMQTVLGEAKVNIAQVKDVLSEYSRNTAEVDPLKTINGLLQQVQGSLSILSLEKAQQLLKSSNDFISNNIIKNNIPPSTEELNHLADAISSIEYYMESMMGNWGQPDAILAVAEQSLESLDIASPVAEEVTEEPITAQQVTEQPEAEPVTEEVPGSELSIETIAVEEPPLEIEAGGLTLEDESESLDEMSLDDVSLELAGDAAPLELAGDAAPGLDESTEEISLDGLTLDAGELDALSLEDDLSTGLEEDEALTLDATPEQDAPLEELDFAPDEISEATPEPELTSEPESKADVEAPAEPVASEPSLMDDTIDDEIIEIFMEEAEEEYGNISNLLPLWQNNTADNSPLKDIRRSFHTLKGSGRLVGALDIGEFAWAYENMLNRLLDNTISITPELLQLMERSKQALLELFELFKTGGKPGQSILSLMEYADLLSQGKEVTIQAADSEPAAVSEIAEPVEVEIAEEPLQSELTEEQLPPLEIDPTLLEIYRKEVQTHLAAIDDSINDWNTGKHEASQSLLRSFHTLTGSSRTTGIQPLADVCSQCEHYIKQLQDLEKTVSAEAINVFAEVISLVEETVSKLDIPGEHLPDHTALLNKVNALEIPAEEEPVAQPVAQAVEAEPAAPAAMPDYDEELLEIFLEEGTEILDDSDQTLHDWAANPTEHTFVEALQRQLHTLKGGARMAGIVEMGDLGHSIESLLTAVVDGHMQATKQMFDLVLRAQDRLVKMLELIQEQKGLTPAADLIAEVDHMLESRGADDDVLTTDAISVPDSKPVKEVAAEETPEVIEEISVADEPEQEIEIPEVIEDEITLEAEPIVIEEPPVIEVHEPPAVEVVTEPAPEPAETAVPSAQEPAPEPAETVVPSAQEPAPEPAVTIPEVAKESSPAVETDAQQDRRQSRRVQQEQIRVRADLLDNLVNFAGEVSIYRSRLDQQTNNFRYNITEFDETVKRLREQLRQFEIETEAQIEYRREETLSHAQEEFDPLEMDRFTTMQHLSRAMMESLSDLDSLRGIMNNLTRESETLLVQQARVNTDLQEGLMRTRMVPFSGQAARLRRIVRQTSSELGKHAELHLHGVDEELDRTVLDRVIPPIEHMLRNAIAHGIEVPAKRKQAGKSETGNIHLSIAREGSEAVIKVIDDGAGINIDAIRSKAIERGLIKADANVSKDALLEMIMQSGFSTAETVSQVAGRGVGMDVVNNEIKQLGGIFHIDTEQGKGTTFTVHLPLTLAISRALMVNVGEDTYAIPLLSVEGVERVPAAKLNEISENENPVYEWVGEEYQFMHLGTVMGINTMNLLDSDSALPVLMVRSGENRAAILVDSLLGSREIVVKPVGPQLSTLRGISGATIMGDGSVVLIIDLGVLIRLAATVKDIDASYEEESIESVAEPVVEEDTTPLIMVVDDSITVRKVTTRLLERHEMNVVAAKDGVDALAQLQETIPDVMLLDVEMPRMDGFELATNMRNDERLKNIPIIMITSRTGQKHRDRAASIGVNIYMGKPYTEPDLLDNIHLLTGK